MKSMLIILTSSVLLYACQAAVLPERVQANVCRKSHENYEQCLREAFENARPHFLEGVPELDFPGIDPLIINETSVNRTLNDLVTIRAILKNVRVIGLGSVVIDDLKVNLEHMVGEIHLTVPRVEMTMEHDVSGQLLIIPLRNKGFFRGNFTNLQMFMKAKFSKYTNEGIEYFAVDKFDTKFRVGDGVIKIISKNPELQFSADLITNFYNENPRLVMDAINPIYNEYSNQVIKQEINNYLAKIPAEELLPE